MKAWAITSFNNPWELIEQDIPEPLDGQVLIKIHASGLCGTDVHVTKGMFPIKLPLVPGHEGVGEIVKLGPGVTNFKVGDRVGVCWHQKGCGRCPYCQSHRDLYCTGFPTGPITWMQLGGAMAEYMVAESEGCILLPNNLPYKLAAPLFCAGYTVSSGYHNACAKPLEVVCVIGIGGLGHLAIQLAKAKGHPVIAITENEDKKALALSLGADMVIVATSSFGIQLKKLGGADIILDCSSSNTLSQDALLGLKPEGRFVLMGIDSKPFEFSNMTLIHNQAKIIGSTQNHKSDLIDILELTASGLIKPMVETFSFNQCQEAFNLLKDNKLRFRAVIEMI